MRTLSKRNILTATVLVGFLWSPDRTMAEDLPPPQATLELEWELVDDAIAYEVKLTPKKEGAAPIVLSAPENKINARVPIGEYKLQIRSQDKNNKYWGRWSKPSEIEVVTKRVQLVIPENESVIKPKSEKRAEVRFEWNSVPEAKKYTLRLWTDDGAEPVEFKTKEITKTLQLLPGHSYFWYVTFETERSVRYQADPLTYSFMLLGHPLEKPIIDPEVSTDESVKLSWSKPPGTQSFRVKFSRHDLDATVWQPLKEFESTDLTDMKPSIPQAGVFRIEVTAQAKTRMDSPLAFREFVVKPSERKLMAALQPLLDSAKPMGTKASVKDGDDKNSSEKDVDKEIEKDVPKGNPKKIETKAAAKNTIDESDKKPAGVVDDPEAANNDDDEADESDSDTDTNEEDLVE